jgi:hypothetical protein
MGLLDLFTGGGGREERCPSTHGHYTIFGTLRCDECDGVVEPDDDAESERRSR